MSAARIGGAPSGGGGLIDRRWEGGRQRRQASSPPPVGYYGLPLLHRSHWKWLIVFYFWLGGIAGASYLIASLAALAGGPTNERIARVGRYLSLAALLPCPPLLILDLGRPERFLHMLRVLKLRSPMSVGTWGLLAFSGFCALSAAIQAARDGLLGPSAPANALGRLPARAIGGVGSVPAFFLGGYTGVLLAATAVPLWTKNHLLMGPLFLASALSSAAAALSLVLAALPGTPGRTLERLERLDRVGLVAELVLLLAVRLRLPPAVARPLATGPLSHVFRVGVLGTGLGAPLALQLAARFTCAGPSRWRTALGALLTLLGGFLLRYVMVVGGHQSADDPAATFAITGGRTPIDPPTP